MKEVGAKEEVVAKPSTFVMSYDNVEQFANNYRLDKHVLGEGKQSY